MNKMIIIVLSLLLTISCSHLEKNTAQEKINFQHYISNNKLTSQKQISAFNFYGWNALDDQHLIIRSSLKKSFLIELGSKCYNMDFPNGLKIERSGNLSVHDNIQVLEVYNLNIPSKKCFIKNIYKLTTEQAKELKALVKK